LRGLATRKNLYPVQGLPCLRSDKNRRHQAAPIILNIPRRTSGFGITDFTPDGCGNHSISHLVFLLRPDQIDVSGMADRSGFNRLLSRYACRFVNAGNQRAYFYLRTSFSDSVTRRNKLLLRDLSDRFIFCDYSFGSRRLFRRREALWVA